MKKFARMAVAAAIAGLSFGASASPVFADGVNLMKYINYENEYRAIDPLTGTCVGCLAAVAGDPSGYRRIDPTIAGNTAVGDLFIGILSFSGTFAASTSSQVYFPTPGNLFTGYFVQQVTALSMDSATGVHLSLSSAADPFGILQAGEMFRFYSNTATFNTGGTGLNAADITAGVLSATSGTFWASLGDPAGKNGYAYTHTDTGVINATNTLSYTALDIILRGPGYNAGLLSKINDAGESELGGAIAASDLVCNATEIAGAQSCTDFVAQSKIGPNSRFGSALFASPWMYESQDPVYLNKIPEPGSLALMGLAIAGMGCVRRRKSA